MRRSYIFIALAMVAALTTVSCKSNRKVKEPTQEEVREMKKALADSVLSEIDSLAEKYWNVYGKSFNFKDFGLTDREKLAKPDYLLNPSVVDTLVTKFQKISALGIYAVDMGLCKAYGISYVGIKEAAAKLAVELSVPFYVDYYSTDDVPVLEKIKETYSACKERGELSLFWILENAVVTEINYILAQNPELFFSKISEEQWQMFNIYKQIRRTAIAELSEYDEDIAVLVDVRAKSRITVSDKERDDKNKSLESAKQYHIKNKDKYIAKRNALLQ